MLLACGGGAAASHASESTVAVMGLPDGFPARAVPVPADGELIFADMAGDPATYTLTYQFAGDGMRACMNLFTAYESAGYTLREPLAAGTAPVTTEHRYGGSDWQVQATCHVGDDTAGPATLDLHVIPRLVATLRPASELRPAGPGAPRTVPLPDLFPRDVPLPGGLRLVWVQRETLRTPWVLHYELGRDGTGNDETNRDRCRDVFSPFAAAGWREADAYDWQGAASRVFANAAHTVHIDCLPVVAPALPSAPGEVIVAVYGPLP